MKDAIKRMLKFLNENKHKIFTFIVGLAFIFLVCFCIVSLGRAVYRVFVPADIYTDSAYETLLYGGSVYETSGIEEYEEASAEFFENYLANFIRQDIPYFNDPTQVDDEYIISHGIWQAITLNNAQGVYTYDKKGNFRVPKDDVEMFSHYVLDYASKIKHKTVDICGKFKYNALSKTYTVKSSGSSDYLIPDVIDIKEGENDTYILTVDCYNETMLSSDDPTNDPANFVRRVTIVMQDMGIQSYNDQTGSPVHRYMILSMNAVSEDDMAEQETELPKAEDDIELN